MVDLKPMICRLGTIENDFTGAVRLTATVYSPSTRFRSYGFLKHKMFNLHVSQVTKRISYVSVKSCSEASFVALFASLN